MTAAPRMAVALVKREATWAPPVIVIVTAIASVWAAWYVVEATASGGDPVPFRRFDRVVLNVMLILLLARIATRVEADHTHNWTAPFIAGGAPRWHYGATVMGAALGSALAVALTAAIAFAAGVLVFGDNSELLRALPRNMAGSTVLLLIYGGIGAAAAIVLRQSILTFLTVIAIIAAPWILLLSYMRASVEPPLWLVRWLTYGPSFRVPSDGRSFLTAGILAVAGIGLTLLMSHRLAGRQT